MNYKILVIEDDIKISSIIVSYLKLENYIVSVAYDGKAGIELFNSNHYDLILLDIMLPELDGWSVCRKIRQNSSIPIIMLTARDDEDDELYGFELKASDYIKKPFNAKVLLARIRSALELSNPNNSTVGECIIQKGSLLLNNETREAYIDESIISLTNKEFSILYLLASNEKKVFNRDSILTTVWEYDYIGETRIVDNHIKKIRKALGSYAYYINTIFGVGYKFEVK